MMSEDIKIRIRHEKPQAHHEAGKAHEHPAKAHEQAKHHEQHRNVEHARAKAAHEAVSAREVAVDRQDSSHQPREAYVNRELKEMAYQRTLGRVRRQLGPLERLTSRVVHQPAINAVSEAAAKTAARPSGFLGGGLVALLGTSIYYYITKHYGYDYSYTVFLVLLAAGFVAGWLLEALYRLLRVGK